MLTILKILGVLMIPCGALIFFLAPVTIPLWLFFLVTGLLLFVIGGVIDRMRPLRDTAKRWGHDDSFFDRGFYW